MKKLLMLLGFLSLAVFGYSQSKISGIIFNAAGETLPGASILIKGTLAGVSSNELGEFELVSQEDSLVLLVSFLGFQTQEIKVGGEQSLEIRLLPNDRQLGEVVITALGIKRDQKNLGYALQKIESKELSEVKAVNFVDNLAAKVAGLTVSQGATGVGSSSKVTIRGEASFTNNNPLFVVDGVPINNRTIIPFTSDAAAGFQEIDFGNGAMEVNPDDISSISVLKGPSAAALYGTRAANGVILISTKDGSEQKGTHVSFNSSTSIERAFRLPKFQNSYGQGNSGQFAFVDGLGGGVNDNISYSWGPRLDAGLLIPQFDSPVVLPDGSVVRGGDVAVHGGASISPSPFRSHKNNLKDFYETGFTSINNIAVSSGFDKGSMRLSFTDLRSESIIPGVNLNRQTVGANLNFQADPKLRISSSINYVNSQSDNRPSNGYGSENVNYALVAWGPRSLDIAALESYWQPGLNDLQQYSFNYTFFDNPYFTLLENRNSFVRDRVFGNIMAIYELDEHWSISLRSGMDFSSELRQFRRAFSSNRFKNGAYAEHQVGFRENNTDVLLNYKKHYSNFTMEYSLGANRMDQRLYNTQTQAIQLAQPGVYSLSNAASPLEVFQVDARKRINSIYALAKFGYKDFLYLDLTARNDWSSALAGPNSTAGVSFFYPSASASFILSNVVDLPRMISFAKLRANVAQVGNDTDPYQTAGTFQPQTAFNGQPTLSDQPSIANARLKPEQTTSYELGADLRFFKDRIALDFTYYTASTKNQIISLPISISSGYTQEVLNGGEVRSRGIELILSLVPIKKKDFTWRTSLNFSRNVSTVESLPQAEGRLTLGYSGIYDNSNQRVWFQVEEGGRIGDMYGTGYKKTTSGEYLVDANGNFIADNTLQKIGNYNPDFILGISNSLAYKNWDASFLIDWRQGGEIVSRTLALAGVAGQLEETEYRPEGGFIIDGLVNVGSEDNPVYQKNTTVITAESYYRQYYDRNHELHNTYNASYVKLRELSVGYTFKNTGSTGFLKEGRKLRIALMGRNLYAFSEIPHFDPEQLAFQGSQFVSGVEDMSYASSRSYGIKIGLNF